MEQHSPTTEHRLFNQHFTRYRRLAKTALADIYLAGDRHNTDPNSQEKKVFLLLVNIALTQQDGFSRAWQHALSRPAPPSSAYPEIMGFGEEQGQYWLALNNVDGELVSEQIAALDKRGLPLARALNTLRDISQALSSVQAGPFGHLEPGAIQHTDKGYVILNVPLVRVLQQLPDSGRATQKYALHSAYISPSVAVGDAPVTEDDTFSAAALLYSLLAGEPPFGEQSSLSAVTHDYRPAPIKKLHKKTWDELNHALAFQRKPRAENPDKLITALHKSNQRKMLLPAAALGLMIVAVYHFVSKVGDVIQPPPTNQQQAVTQKSQPAVTQSATAQTTAKPPTQPAETESETSTQETINTEIQPAAVVETARKPAAENMSATEEPETEPETITTTAQVDEPEIAEQQPAETEAATKTEQTTAQDTETADNTTEKAQQLTTLLQQAEAAIADGQRQDDKNQSGALTLLRRINELDADNAQAKALLQQLLTAIFDNTEQLIDNKDFEQAQNRLRENDKIIREFMLSDQLKRQVQLESKLTVMQHEQQQVEELLSKAQAAIHAGHLSEDDAADDYALLHLDSLMFKQPDNAEGRKLLREVVKLRQQAVRSALENGELEQAGTYLSDSERLIKKYKLTELKRDQRTLNTTYTTAMQNTKPVAEITRRPATTVTESLPVERPPVNPISIQEITSGDVEPITPADDQEVVEITTTEPVRNRPNQPARNTAVVRPVRPAPSPQPVIRQQQPIVQPSRPANRQVQSPRPGVYTYQPDNQLVEPVNPQLIHQFTATARPLGADPATLHLPEVNPGLQPQPPQHQVRPQRRPPQIVRQSRPQQRSPQVVQQQRPRPQSIQQPQQQPQTVVDIPEIIPFETIPELEEIPLSDIEDILPAAN